ncbi:MBL fold metallo-hydrolase [Ornithinicoccus hortensis]|uniref:Glyoxylase-like metal-dependent hydrolase (Beta-lactamase superfamily II) n=1 Tax=Ornithinicoccus hortensis TaxID=82346 RepID=A0A542YP07_9MICO|nr:MBL fold metallo-hydrolase [Ornithinicoccus hortensis]TQL49845.1 glyoxylase-like metal-dependent hydrolase (beta-lactamase superfamily II) [Ornithinicoccus hortensis]
MSGELRVDHAVTSGTFSLDGGTWEVDNNVWVLGDDTQCVVIDAPHDADAIAAVVGERELVAVLCTHAHDDHIGAVGDIFDRTRAPSYLHPEDRVLWDRVYQVGPDHELADGQVITVAGTEVRVLHTPGHSPGAVCFYVPALGVLFTGDTLFQGGPGATGRSYSDFPTIIDSIRDKLLVLPPETVVHTGHGDSTTIGDEAPHLQEWIDRGH